MKKSDVEPKREATVSIELQKCKARISQRKFRESWRRNKIILFCAVRSLDG